VVRQVADACPHYTKGVPDGHKCDARLVLVGEAPGKYEELAGIPFVGLSGHRLREWWSKVGLRRNDFYITNVVPVRPPGNDISKITPNLLELYTNALLARLGDRLSDPWLVVPTGNTALTATTGIRPRHAGDALITKWRGSILSGSIGRRTVKVVPTIHPAAALRERVLDKTCRADWRRIAAESKTRELDLPQRELIVEPNRAELRRLYDRLEAQPDLWLSFDIETDPSTGEIVCISFAHDCDLGYSITYLKHRDIIQELLALPNPKVGQNFLYDAYWLAQDDIVVRNLAYDAGAMFHALDPNAGPQTSSKDLEDPNAGRSHIKPYSLAYMTSIFTREPYYKEAGRDEEGRFMRVNGDATKLHQLQEYNARDACVTHEVCDALYRQLEAEEMLEFYDRHYRALYEPNLRTMLHGVRLDVARAESVAAGYQAKMTECKAEVAQLAGMPLESVKVYKRQPKDWAVGNPEFLDSGVASKVYGSPWVRLVGKSLSNDKLKKYLYGILKLPPRKRQGKLVADEATLRDLRLKYPTEAGALIDAILEFRKNEKLSMYLREGKCDSDNRVRCQYKNLVTCASVATCQNGRAVGCSVSFEESAPGASIPH
jgi:DNA polymerase